MSDPIGKSPYFRKLRECAYCTGLIGDQRPTFLLRRTDGTIQGPFHAGCAEKLGLRLGRATADVPGGPWPILGVWPEPREETLPE